MNYARRKWRNAVDLRHLPAGTHSLAPKPGSLVRLAFQKWPAEPKLDRAKAGPRGRICTCNLPGLSGTPLLLGYTRLARQAEALAKAGAPGQDCTDTKRGLSPLPLPWATGAGRNGVMDSWSIGLMGQTGIRSPQQSSNPLLHYSNPKLVPREGFPPPTSPS